MGLHRRAASAAGAGRGLRGARGQAWRRRGRLWRAAGFTASARCGRSAAFGGCTGRGLCGGAGRLGGRLGGGALSSAGFGRGSGAFAAAATLGCGGLRRLLCRGFAAAWASGQLSIFLPSLAWGVIWGWAAIRRPASTRFSRALDATLALAADAATLPSRGLQRRLLARGFRQALCWPAGPWAVRRVCRARRLLPIFCRPCTKPHQLLERKSLCGASIRAMPPKPESFR